MPPLTEVMETIKQLKAKVRNLESLEQQTKLIYLEMCEQGIEEDHYEEE